MELTHGYIHIRTVYEVSSKSVKQFKMYA